MLVESAADEDAGEQDLPPRVLQLEDADEKRQRWRVLEPPELARDATLRAPADWPGFDASRQVGARYRVIVRQGWLGDFAIMPEALRAAARSGEVQ